MAKSWIRTAGLQIVENLLRLPWYLQGCHSHSFFPWEEGREVRVICTRRNSCSAASLNGVCSVFFCLACWLGFVEIPRLRSNCHSLRSALLPRGRR